MAATTDVTDSRGTTLTVGDLVYSFAWGDNYIVSQIVSRIPRIQLRDTDGNSVGWCEPSKVAFVAKAGEYSNG